MGSKKAVPAKMKIAARAAAVSVVDKLTAKHPPLKDEAAFSAMKRAANGKLVNKQRQAVVHKTIRGVKLAEVVQGSHQALDKLEASLGAVWYRLFDEPMVAPQPSDGPQKSEGLVLDAKTSVDRLNKLIDKVSVLADRIGV